MLSLNCEAIEGTNQLAQSLAAHVRTGDCLALDGDLGVGKTTLARAFITAFYQRHKVEPPKVIPSPTFNLLHVYDDIPVPIWHFDFYRLQTISDALELGYEDCLDAIAVIEWAERLNTILPPHTIRLKLHYDPHKPNGRIITINTIDDRRFQSYFNVPSTRLKTLIR